MKTWKTDCVSPIIEKALTEIAKKNGWKGASLEVGGEYRFFGLIENGELNSWVGVDCYPEHQTISIEEAVKRLKTDLPKPDVVLHLTNEEGMILRDIMGYGIIGVGRRELADSIWKKIKKLGIEGLGGKDMKGTINFFG